MRDVARTRLPLRHVLLAAGLALARAATVQAGTFVGSDSFLPSIIVHPTGYTGTGGTVSVTVCIDPTSAHAAAMVQSVQNLIGTWNALGPQSPNLFFGTNNNIPATDLDFESVALHEVGHCIGLGHPNLGSEAGFAFGDPNSNYTKTTQGVDLAYDLDDGADNVIGSSDDARDDDENVCWFRKSNNDPFTLASTVDTTTYSRSLGDIPGGHAFAANADRGVGALLGHPDSEAVMQQEANSDEDQRALGHDDVAQLRLGMAGLDETEGTSDDYTVSLVYAGLTTGCDIVLDFDSSQTSGGVCQVTITSMVGDHYRVTAANAYFNDTISWFFNPLPTGATTTTTSSSSSTSTTSTSTTSSTTTTTLAGTGQLLDGKKLLLVDNTDTTLRKAKVLSKDLSVNLGGGNGSADDPVLNGGSLRMRTLVGTPFDVTYSLPAGGWSYLGTPGSNVGYKYKDKLQVNGPIRIAIVKNGMLVKAVGKGSGLGHVLDPDPPDAPNPTDVVLTIGGKPYCMSFGGSTVFLAGRKFIGKDALAPGACP